MKVSLVAPQDVSLISGGLRTQIMETARHLPAYQIEVDFYDSWSFYDENSIDLIHLFSANASSYHLANTLHKVGIPYVISPVIFSNHNSFFIRSSRWLESWSKKVFSGIWTDYSVIGKSCHLSRRVLPNTQAEAELIQNGFEVDSGKIEVVPNGVEKRFAEAQPDLFKRKFGLSDFVLFVGTIGSRRKNVMRLIEALKTLDLPGVFIGNIMDDERGRKTGNEIEKNPNLHLLEPLDHESPLLASAYAASRVFILPSYYETPGIAAMEAALSGSAIAITERGGTREYFEDYAHYLQPESTESIKSAIQSAWNHPPGERLKNHILQNFTWPRIAQQTANIYKSLVRNGS